MHVVGACKSLARWSSDAIIRNKTKKKNYIYVCCDENHRKFAFRNNWS